MPCSPCWRKSNPSARYGIRSGRINRRFSAASSYKPTRLSFSTRRAMEMAADSSQPMLPMTRRPSPTATCPSKRLAWGRDPASDLFIHGVLTQQVPMVHAIADPLPRWGERQCQSRIFVAPQSAVYGHHPIPEKIAGLLPDVAGNGIAHTSSGNGTGCRRSHACSNRSNPCQSSSSRLPYRISVIPALRSSPKRANGAEYGLTTKANIDQIAHPLQRSTMMRRPRKTSLRKCCGQLGPPPCHNGMHCGLRVLPSCGPGSRTYSTVPAIAGEEPQSKRKVRPLVEICKPLL